MINAALQRREAAYSELERRRRNGRSQSVIDAPKRIAAPVINGKLPPGEQGSDAASDVIVPADSISVAPTGSDREDHVHVP